MNLHIGSGSAPQQIAVGNASTTVVSENNARVGLVLTNISSGTMYLAFNNTAVVGSGIVLKADGGVWFMDEFSLNYEQVNAIAHSANSALAVQEFVSRA